MYLFELEDDLEVGDTVEFKRNGEVIFEQEIESMEIDRDQVEEAGSGQEVAVKVDEKAKEDTEVYKK